MAQELDNFQIVISADTSNAKKNIDAVANSLRRVRDIFKTLNTSKAELKGVYQVLKNISQIDFSKVEGALRSLADIIGNLDKVNKKNLNALTSGIATEQTKPVKTDSSIDETTKAIEEQTVAMEANKTAQTEVQTFAYLNEEQQEKLAKAIEKVNNALKPEQIEKLRNELTSMGYDAKQVDAILKSLGVSMEKANKTFSGGTTRLGRLWASLKRIALYRAIRRAIQVVVNAFKEGIQAVSQFDEATNKAMSSIMSSWSTLKTSLGSMVAPLIQMFSPALNEFLRGITNVSNRLAELFAYMNGQDAFVKAKDQVVDYAETLKKVNNTSLGIDELNVVKGNDDAEKYESVAVNVDKALGNLLKGLKNAFSRIWDVIVRIVDTLSPIVDKIITALLPIIEEVANIVEALEPVVNTILRAVDALTPVVTKIVEWVSKLVEAIMPPLSKIVTQIGDVLVSIANLISSLMPILDPIVSLVSLVLGIALDLLDTALKPIITIIKAVLDTSTEIWNLLTPFLDFFAKFIDEAIKPLWDFVWGIFEPIYDLANGVLGEIVNFVKNLLSPAVNAVSNGFKNIWEGANNVKEILEGWLKPIKEFFAVIKHETDANGNAPVGFGNGLFNETGRWGDGYQFGDVFGSMLDWTAGLFGKGWLYANGGFPEDGLFFANHGELVGKFTNGQTAVANNEQIVEGIKQGVMEAMQASGGANVNVYLDSREIASKVEQRINNKGALIITGGTLSYGK